MKKTIRTINQDTYAERCKKCGTRISGLGKDGFRHNMKVHMDYKHNYEGIEEVKK